MAHPQSHKNALPSTIPESSHPPINTSSSASEPNALQPHNVAYRSSYLRPDSSTHPLRSLSQDQRSELVPDIVNSDQQRSRESGAHDIPQGNSSQNPRSLFSSDISQKPPTDQSANLPQRPGTHHPRHQTSAQEELGPETRENLPSLQSRRGTMRNHPSQDQPTTRGPDAAEDPANRSPNPNPYVVSQVPAGHNRTAPENSQFSSRSRNPVRSSRARQDSPSTTVQQRLAQAVSELLMRNPLNADKRESSFQFLCRVFRKDQTYSDLVDELESYGLVFDRKALTQCLLFAVRASNIGDQTCLDQTTPAGALSEPARGLATTTAVPFSDRPNPVSIPKMRNTSASSHTEQSAAAAALANHGVAEPSITAPSSNNAVSATTIGAEQESSIQIRSILPQGQVLRPSPDSDERSRKRYRSTIEIMDSTQPRSDEDNMMVSPSKQPRLENPTGQAPNRHSPVLAIVESLARTAESPLSSPPAHLGPGNRNSKSEEGHERGDSPEVSHIRNRKDIAQALRPSDVLPERVSYNADTIARDILRAAGHHPTEAPLNHHLKELRENFSAVNTQTDLETFRWDLVDSDGPPAPRLEDIKVDLSPLIKPRRHDRDDGISGDSVQETPMDALDATAPMSPLTNYFSARYQSRQTTPAHDVAWPGAGPSVATPRSDRSPESEHGSSLHFTPSNGPKEAGEDILPHPQSSPVPEFPIYVCEWEGCQAELHDAHTLRRHVRKCHLKNQTSCLWADCPRSMKRFQPDELREHVQAAHIQPQVSKYGNGPTFPGNGDGMAPYLRDEDGAIITPDVATAREHDTIIFPANETAIEAYHELHGHYSDLERARQVFEAVQRQRRKIGFGLEREGCIFATPERNRVLDDQEDVFEVVPCPIED